MVDHPNFTIAVDTREKKPYPFHRFANVSTEDVRLKTGDYCIYGDWEATDTEAVQPNFAVERKSKQDFLQSITWQRERFEKELARTDGFSEPMPVVIEDTQYAFENADYYADVSPNAVFGTLDSHVELFNVDYHFTRNRQAAEARVYEFLRERRLDGVPL